MTTREKLDQVLAKLPEGRLGEVYDFARYLRWLEEEQEERADWLRFQPGEWDELYGPDEPEYSEADVKGKPGS
jgi:hypothetical protein